MIDTSGWTVRCAGCGLVRPWSERWQHVCPYPVRLEDALDVLARAQEEGDPE